MASSPVEKKNDEGEEEKTDVTIEYTTQDQAEVLQGTNSVAFSEFKHIFEKFNQ